MSLLACSLMIALLASGSSGEPPSVEVRKEKIQSVEENATQAALQRKARSEERLRKEGVPLNAFLPAIEDETQARIRKQDAVADRAMALLVVALKGEGLDHATIQGIVKDYGLAEQFTPQERAFIDQATPSEQDRIQFSWRYEAAWTLLWSLGYVDELAPPTSICDVPKAVRILKEHSAQQFRADARLRSPAEILDQADLIYRYHWAVVDAEVKGKPAPAKIDPGVAMERHHALNWLIGYMDQEWDDVTTDT